MVFHLSKTLPRKLDMSPTLRQSMTPMNKPTSQPVLRTSVSRSPIGGSISQSPNFSNQKQRQSSLSVSHVIKPAHTTRSSNQQHTLYTVSTNQASISNLAAQLIGNAKRLAEYSTSSNKSLMPRSLLPEAQLSWIRPGVSSDLAPAPRAHHTASLAGSSLVVFGGIGKRQYNDVHVYDLSTRTWRICHVIGQEPAPRHGHAAWVCGESLWVFGGLCGTQCCNNVYSLNLGEADLSPPPLCIHTFVVVCSVSTYLSVCLSICLSILCGFN